VVPPATLWVSDETITTVIDTEHRVPGMDMRQIPSDLAVERGVYAYTAIRAPRGLHERVFHEWYGNGQFVMSIPLEITGGREEGYRAWTHKTGFSGAVERWHVRVITESGQLLGDLRFAIGGRASEAERQPQPLPKTAGVAEESQFETSPDVIADPALQQQMPPPSQDESESSAPSTAEQAAPEATTQDSGGDDDDGPTPAPGETIQVAPSRPAEQPPQHQQPAEEPPPPPPNTGESTESAPPP
jgi:hypothetical protein